MWLLDTFSLELKEFNDSNIPNYAILSHTWDKEEVTFVEMQNFREAARATRGFLKVVNFCECARVRGYRYGWMDTCGIDKRNSADLSEAINSMFRYYRNAEECIVFLSDVPALSNHADARQQQLDAMRSSRWFTRGWTLQELIAPKRRSFFSRDWKLIDDQDDLPKLITSITNINVRLLQNRDLLSTFCTAERMSWAARRQTTRSEDMAYALMGLFDIHMPVIYGEGITSAFKRLQEEIFRTSFDQTIFAWRGNYESSGLLAKAPTDFAESPKLGLWGPRYLAPFAMTNVGLSIRINIAIMPKHEKASLPADVKGDDVYAATLACDVWNGKSWVFLVLYLKLVRGGRFYVNGKTCDAYRRVKCDEWLEVPLKWFPGGKGPGYFRDVLILEDQHSDLINRTIEDDLSRRENIPFIGEEWRDHQER